MKRKTLCSSAVLLLVLVGQASAQQPEARPPRVLSVSGTGTVQRQADRAVVMVAVQSRATTAQVAAQTNARKMDAVFAALRKLGIVAPQVQTVSYSLRPDYYRPPDGRDTAQSPRIVAYWALNSVRVQVDSIARVGAVLDAVIAAGANRIDDLSFELRDPDAARLEALRIAVTRARAEADVLAAAAGQKLGAPQSITSSSNWQPGPQYRMMADVAAAAPAPTPVEPGNLSVTANVNITYFLEDR